MINDTRLHNHIDIHLPNYSLVRKDKITNDSTSGGVAIAIPQTWDVQPLSTISESGNGYEAVGVLTSPPGGKPMKLMTLYNHPQHYIPQHLISSFVNTTHNNQPVHGLIGGDLNCPHEAFSSRFSNIYGTHLLSLVNNMNLMVLENDEPTSFHRGEPNVLDLFICDPSSHLLIQECYVGESVGSDHLPLIAHMKVQSKSLGHQRVFTKRVFDSNAFKAEVEVTFSDFDPSCSNKEELDGKILELTNKLRSIRDKHTSEKQIPHARTNLSKDVLSWIKIRKSLLTSLKKSSSIQEKSEFSRLYNKANKIVRALLDAHDKKEKEKVMTQMQSLRNSSDMWKQYKKLKCQLEPNSALKRPLINTRGEKVFDTDGKAELFAARLEDVHKTPTGPLFDARFETEVNNYIQQHNHLFSAKHAATPEPDEDHRMLEPITITDIKRRIQESKTGSAPGADQISYGLLAICPDILLVKFAVLINYCLSIGYFPRIWKDAKVTMVQKPNKEHTNPKNYRPISLLPVLGKIFEGLLSERLVTFLEQNKIITKYQAGYRRGRSTQEHIFRLSQQVFNGFKQRKCTIAVLLDVEAAFDAVWTNGLIFKLANLNLPSNFLRILCSFLKDRSLSVHLEGTVSRSIYLKAGTPQGACLSPILFNIYVNDIPFDDMTDCDPSQFADDTGIWCTGLDTANTGSKIQNSLSLMENWCKKWRVKLSPSKTNVLLFTRCYKAHQNKPTLMLFNEQLTYVNEANFLGVKFDTRLTWEPQIRQLMTKAQPRINLIRALKPLNPIGEPDLLLHLYKAIVRPVYEYSAIANVTAALCHQLKLQQQQNSVIRCILNLPKYTSADILHDASGLPKLHEHSISFAKKRLSAMKKSGPLIQ